MTKLRNSNDNTEINNFEVSNKLHPRVISGANGTVSGVYALSESLKRGDALLSQSTNVKEVANHV